MCRGWFLALACSTRQRVQSDQPVQHGSSLIGGILACLLIVVFSTAQASKSFIDISLLWYGSIPTTPLATPLTNMTNLVNSTNLPSQYRPSFFQTWDEEVIQNPYAASSWTLFLYLFLVAMWLLSLFRSCFMIQLFLRSARQLHAVVLSRLLRVCRDSVLTRCRAALLLPVTIAVVTAMLMESVSTELASVCTGGKEQIVLRG